MRITLAWVLAVAVVGGCSATLVEMGRQGWPNVHHDAVLYLTPAVNRANGRGDTFSVFAGLYLLKENWKFDVHGQVYQFTLAHLTPGSSLPDFLRAMGWLNAATVIVSFVYFLILLRRTGGVGAGAAAIWTALGAVGVANVCLYLQGRPEHLCPIILGACGLVRLAAQTPQARVVVDGVEVGLIAATSPSPAVTLGLFRLTQLAMSTGPRELVRRGAVLAAVTATTWAAAIAVACPYSPVDVALNTIRMGRAAALSVPRVLRFVHLIWLLNPSMPMIGVTYGMWFVGTGLSVTRPGLAKLNRLTAVIGFLGMIGYVFRVGVMQATTYNVLGLYPVALAWVGESLCRLEWPRTSRATHRVGGTVLAAGVVVMAFGFVRSACLLDVYRAQGFTLAEARAAAAKLFDQLTTDERVGLFPSIESKCLILLDKPDWHCVMVSSVMPEDLEADEKALGVRVRTLLLPQTRRGELLIPPMASDDPPRALGPFQLVSDYWIAERPTLLGAPLATVMPGYQFAVYRRP